MRALFCLLLLTGPAAAYTLDTVASESCHEKLTVEALLTVLEVFGSREFPIPDDDVLRRLLASDAVPDPGNISEFERFVLLSLVVGVRSPDTEGHSTLDLAALRRLHADPAPEGQYAHALRGPDDDYLPGDVAAVDGTLGIIRAELDEVFAGGTDPRTARVGKRAFFIEHYGRVNVTVLLPAYHLGRAIHALQDAHAHMVWDDSVTHVVHVLNYVDAVNNVRETDRDGMAHSDALDDCNREDTQPLVERATERTTALTAAVLIAVNTGNSSFIDRGLTACPEDLSTLPPLPPEAPDDVPLEITCGWLVYNPPCRAAIEAGDDAAMAQVCCTADNDFCGASFAEVAKKKPAGPYLGCQSVPGTAGVILALLLLLVFRRRAAPAAVLILLLSPPARAETSRAFAALEGHGSLLNDTPNSSLLDVTFGYSARGGYRWDRWRAVLHVEHNAWLPTELGVKLDAGALNVGAGAEALFFDDRIRVSLVLGPSILLFDTVLDDAGTVGLFAEARPLGFRYPVADFVTITFEPLTFSVVAPVLRDPPLRKIERRTYAGVEFGFF